MRLKTILLALLCLLPITLLGSSCKGTDTARAQTVEQHEGLELCGMCGEIAGSDKCCVASVAECPDCHLHAGSPGCCKIKQGNGNVALCPDCGMIKGSVGCCYRELLRCADCGMIKGSPGCCVEKK